jgi:hypothetical protein
MDQMSPKKPIKNQQYPNQGGMRENNMDMNMGGGMGGGMGQVPQNYYNMYMQQMPQMMYYNQQQGGMPQQSMPIFNIFIRYGK